MDKAESYPLHWPAWIPRTERWRIASSQFKVGDAQARDELFAELDRLGAKNVIVSSNIPLRKDGRPYANQARPTDAGVAVFFTRKGNDQVIASDRYPTIGENMRAIGKTIEAIRGIARWGTSQMVDAAFRGFAALPETTSGESWWKILGVEYDTEREVIDRAYRHLVKEHHPDRGGDREQFERVERAYREALEAINGGMK